MRKMNFRVDGTLPPKKDGANSMWNKDTEAPRLVALRHQALEALGDQPPFSREIRLGVRIYVGRSNTRTSGDLDNFITGICDGLMKADQRANLHELFNTPENAAIHPLKDIAIDDDSQIIEIHVEKLIGETESQWYDVEIKGK